MEAKAVVDILSEVQAEADVKTLGDTLVKVEAWGEAGQTIRGKLAEW